MTTPQGEPATPPSPHHAELTDVQRDAMRAEADRRRHGADTYASVLEDIATNGLPAPEDCTPWEEIRERLWEQRRPGDDGARVA